MSACYLPFAAPEFAGPEAFAAKVRAAMAGNPAPYLNRRRYFGREAFRPLPAPARPTTARPAPVPRVPYLRPWPPVRPAAFTARYPVTAQGLEGFEGFLSKIKKAVKKVGKGVAKVAKKTVKAVSNAVRSVGRFARKNWKWVVVAAAAAATIYTMGGAAGIAAKLSAGMAKLKGGVIAAGKWTAGKASACMSGMQKLLGGKKIGELQPTEVEAMGEANEAAGQAIVPPEILKCFSKQALTLAEEAAPVPAQAAPAPVQAEPEEAPEEAPATRTRNKPDKEKKDLPKWVLPAAAAAGGLALALVLGK